jgi:hypothetical protein
MANTGFVLDRELALDQIEPGEDVKKTLYEWAAEENPQSHPH